MQVVETVAEVRRIRRDVAGQLGAGADDGFSARGARFAGRAGARRRTTMSASRSSSTRRSSGRPRTWRRTRAIWSAIWRCWRRPAPIWCGRRRWRRCIPPGFQTYVTVEEVTKPLEGAARPTHFRGVATVVAKLFNVFQPDRAYFGQKDAQQAVVIQQMVRDLDFPLEIVDLPHRARAGRAGAVVPQHLSDAGAAGRRAGAQPGAARGARCLAGGRARRRARCAQIMRGVLAAEPLARPDYVSAADPVTLAELGDAGRGVLLSMAVRIGKARLIDNIRLIPDS